MADHHGGVRARARTSPPAIRTGAFAIPGGLGVQEGGSVLVGAVLGIPAPVALALALARRVREFLLGVPGLLAWQAPTLEGALRA